MTTPAKHQLSIGEPPGGGDGADSAVDSALKAQAAAAPASLALVTDPGEPGGALTKAELDRRTADLAGRLREAARDSGTGPCAVEIGNDQLGSTILLLIAALRTDVPIVFRDHLASADEQSAVREELHRAGVSIVTPDLTQSGTVRTEVRRPQPDAAPGPQAVLPRHSVVLASGGTTGRPKLTIDTALRQTGVNAHSPRVTARLNWSADQTQLVIGRLHHAAPLTFFIHGLTDGNCLLVPRRFAASSALRLIQEQRVHWLQATPFQLQHLARWLQRHPADLGSLRGLLHMSAPCPPSVKRFWLDQISPDRVFEIYGATEGIGLTVASGREWLEHPGTVGRGFFTQVRILDGHLAPLPKRTTGQVFMRSLSGSAGSYLHGSGGLRVSPDGFRSVGDHGYLDEDRYLILEPRRVDLINVAGEKVYPAEIEGILAQHPGIIQAAVTGLPDERMGMRPIAFVICWPAAAPGERELIEFCHRSLSRFKLPRQIFFVDELPHNQSGKIDRRRLQEIAQAVIAKEASHASAPS